MDTNPQRQEAIQTISQDPVAHLLRFGHPHQDVRRYITQELEPLAHWAERITEDSVYVLKRDGKQYEAMRHQLQAGLRNINRLLVATMENHALLPASTLTDKIREIVYELRGYIGFASSTRYSGSVGFPGGYENLPLTSDEEKTLTTCITELISQLLVPNVISYLLNSTEAVYETIRQNAGRTHFTPLLYDANKSSDTGIIFDGYEAAEREKDHHLYKDDARYYYSQRSLRTGMQSLNEYFCAMMEQRIMPWSKEEINYLVKCFAELHGWIQFATEFKVVEKRSSTGIQEEFIYERLPEFTKQAIAYFLLYYQKRNQKSTEESNVELQEAFKTLRAARYDNAISELKDDVKRGKNEDEIISLIAPRANAEANRFLYSVASLQSVAHTLIEHPFPQKNMHVLIESKDVSATKKECRCIKDFVKPLLHVCTILANEPIMTESGSFEENPIEKRRDTGKEGEAASPLQKPQVSKVPLKKHCHTCGFQNDSDAKFCTHCGTKLA